MLKDIVEVAMNNSECVVLKVKEGHEVDLISLGCFDGDETMFRLTKGETVTCTVFKKRERPFPGSGGEAAPPLYLTRWLLWAEKSRIVSSVDLASTVKDRRLNHG